jgi:DNA-binding response OmpR family regulator
MRILMIEDDSSLAAAVSGNLRKAGFAVDAFALGADGLAALASSPYDLLILDLRLPDADGINLLRTIRVTGHPLPILVLTARDSTEDRVLGLDSGADDYLVKPFETSELIARVRALLRRPGAALGVVLEAGNVSFDTSGRVVSVAGARLTLTRRELALLDTLMRGMGRVIPKAVLEEKLYGYGEEFSSNSLEVLVHRLRRKLLSAEATAEVHTVRGVGYLLTEQS